MCISKSWLYGPGRPPNASTYNPESLFITGLFNFSQAYFTLNATTSLQLSAWISKTSKSGSLISISNPYWSLNILLASSYFPLFVVKYTGLFTTSLSNKIITYINIIKKI